MTLEMLFARAAQGRAFLLLTAGGVLLGLLMQGAGLLHRLWKPAGMAADVLWALAAAGLTLYAAFLAGSGLRAYALLGLCVGLALYRAGLLPLLCGAGRLLQKLFRQGRNER